MSDRKQFDVRMEPHRSGSWRIDVTLGDNHVGRTQGMPRPVAESVVNVLLASVRQCGGEASVSRPLGAPVLADSD